MTPSDLFALATGVIGVFSAVAMGVYTVKSGRSSIQKDVINAYEKRLKQIEGDMAELSKQAAIDKSELLKQIRGVQDMLSKREIELKIVTDLLQGRDPQMQEFMATVLTAAPAAAIAATEAKNAAMEARAAASDASVAATGAKDEAARASAYQLQNAHALELLLRHFNIPLVPPALS